MTLANFQISGKTPYFNDELKTMVSGFQMKSAASLISLVEILSGPGAFIFIFIFHLFREGCPSTEVVFQGALQLKTNYNIQLECQKIRTHNIKNLFTTI